MEISSVEVNDAERNMIRTMGVLQAY